ncbi:MULTISPECIES: helix-turn-helix domain-containing protein [Streptomyces]|uniref:helix-turn-helix domain-containing protein n=1 Tax=Streptomyces TaxID=1883 RepID=UPI0013DB983A|nr:helix-turn-helix transcriptional regulator [Streptomyces aureoverticillatus]QIB47885.1 helix-turn-helix transcriptional regulator [Streptomyces aureoverticillatus]
MGWLAGLTGGRSDDLTGAQLARDVSVMVAGLLAAQGIPRTQLAERMGVSPGRVSQILSGDENLTLHSLANIAGALDRSVVISFCEPPPAEQPVARGPARTEDGPVRPYAPVE